MYRILSTNSKSTKFCTGRFNLWWNYWKRSSPDNDYTHNRIIPEEGHQNTLSIPNSENDKNGSSSENDKFIKHISKSSHHHRLVITTKNAITRHWSFQQQQKTKRDHHHTLNITTTNAITRHWSFQQQKMTKKDHQQTLIIPTVENDQNGHQQVLIIPTT